MRALNGFRRQSALAAFLAVAGLSGFGVSPVRAQTPAAQTPAAQTPAPDAGPVRRISIDEAVALALENNLDLQVQRVNPQIQDMSVAQVRTNYTPVFQSAIGLNDQTQPPSNQLAGGATSITNTRTNFDFGVNQLTKWGGNYSVGFNNARNTTNNIFTNFNPQLNPNLSLSLTQPLLRNFRIDGVRQQLLVSQKNREISEVQLQQSIALTSRNVRNAYYDLMFAIGNLTVQHQSLELAQQSLKDNRARVEIGTMAPIDIVQAEAEVAQREESVILAEAAIQRTEDALRTLVYNQTQPDFWQLRIEPTDTPVFRPTTVDVESAIANALRVRTDLEASRRQLESNDVNIRFFRNQTQPDVNASVTYFSQALGGTFLQRDGLGGPIIGQNTTSYPSALRTMLAGDFPTWTVQMQVSYPIGQAAAEAQLARARLQDQQARRQLQSQELQAAAQIRERARQVTTNAKRVDATRASRTLAERRLEAEEKKFQAGMTTSFLVFQAQRDLNQARNNELQALLDHARSVVEYETVQVAPLGGSVGVTSTNTGTTTTTGTQQQQQQQQQQ
ncbi:MAG: TolC family protein [Acidobacteria bacterium]|nr:TolC family protein [Acidobacteriota bacterium]